MGLEIRKAGIGVWKEHMKLIYGERMSRILSKIRCSGLCWEWTGKKDKNGYGIIVRNGASLKAHREMFLMARGIILPKQCVRHSCDNPCCVAPYHLSVGCHKDNMADRSIRGRCGNLKGENNGRSKLTNEDIIMIRKCAEKSGPVLADAFGVSKTLISRIRNRKSWTHI